MYTLLFASVFVFVYILLNSNFLFAMKILKRPQNVIFDTDDPFSKDSCIHSVEGLKPLHHTHSLTDFEFLSLYFSCDHAVFTNFGTSYFFCYE